MKNHMISMAFVATVLLCGCSSTKFTEYHGAEVYQGAGGNVRTVDGIDFWENGEPDRKYKILGVLDEGSKHHLPLGRFSRVFSGSGNSDARDSAIAKGTHKYGGNAVVFAAKNQEQSDDGQLGGRNHQRFILVVVKYVP